MEAQQIIAHILTSGGIAGLIAVIIVGGIVLRYVKHGMEDIPPILSISLSTIIGFYFGSGVSVVTAVAGGQ